MSGSNVSRYLPTLTEVVSPDTVLQTGHNPATQQVQWDPAPRSTMNSAEAAAITQHVMNEIAPMLEAQWQSVVMPALKQHMEVAVREAIHKALADRGIPD